MTNPDTSTLNGALEQLGITMADNLVTMGVSDADPSDGLTTLASRILDIGPTPPTPTPASITLTADKSILSYADTESAVLTATVLDSSSNPVEGVSVDLYKDSVLWDTLTTGNAGTVSKTYTSLGAGDVGFTAECGSLVTESYTIEDCVRYDSNSYLGDATATTKTVSLGYDLPTHFKVEYEYKITSLSGANSSLMWIGTSNGNAILFNRISGNDTIYKLWVRTNSSGSGDIRHDGSSITVSNDFQSFFITYDGSEVNYNNMITVTNLNGVSLNKIVQLTGSHQTSQQGIIRNIKIKPL